MSITGQKIIVITAKNATKDVNKISGTYEYSSRMESMQLITMVDIQIPITIYDKSINNTIIYSRCKNV